MTSGNSDHMKKVKFSECSKHVDPSTYIAYIQQGSCAMTSIMIMNNNVIIPF